MAPPTKPSSSKGINPAPDFTVNMNRIQTQLEARMKAVRSFLPSRSNLQTPNPNSAGGSFSALSSSGPQPSSHTSSTPQSLAADSAARRAAAEAEFAEDRNLDPNVGIGVVRATGGNSETNGRDRDTARLRGRLLGKRGKGNEGAEKRWVRKEESSDDEAGRSGLGRAKRNGNGNGKKRSRTDMEDEDREEEVVEAIPPEVKAVEEISEKDGQDGDVNGDTENSIPKSTEVEPSAPTTEGNSKKRRKKKKKKSKNKTDEA